jgi:hypothetical protein
VRLLSAGPPVISEPVLVSELPPVELALALGVGLGLGLGLVLGPGLGLLPTSTCTCCDAGVMTFVAGSLTQLRAERASILLLPLEAVVSDRV